MARDRETDGGAAAAPVADTAPTGQEGEGPAGAPSVAAPASPDLPSPAADAEPSVAGSAAEVDAEASDDEADRVSVDLEALSAKAAERDEYLALAQRTQADFENYRKRVARDAAQAESRGIAKLARELLPGLDNLERALAAQDDEGSQLAQGVRLVQAELVAALARVGLEAYSPHGERFDPELHEAMAQQPGGDGAESGTILEVYQPGYLLGGNVIRPARVVVAA